MFSVYITGTDTGIGKTLASCALLHALRGHGLRVAGMKPVASGCERIDGEWKNADALADLLGDPKRVHARYLGDLPALGAFDLIVNATRTKQLTNFRVTGKEDAIKVTPPIDVTLEYGVEFVEDDELVEITPKSIRLRKRFLTEGERKRAGR